MSACLQRILLRAHRRVHWLRRHWAETAGPAEQWMAISHGEVDRILAGPDAAAEQENAFYAEDPGCRRLGEAIAEQDARFAADPRWQRLVAEFRLDDAERDLLCLAVAAEQDPRLRRLYGYLLDETTPADPSERLAAELFGWPPGTRIRPDTPLAGWALATPDPWRADPSLLPWLVHGADLGVEAEDSRDCLHPELLDAIEDTVKRLRGPRPVEIDLAGPAGCGRRTLAAQLCTRLGVGLVVADLTGVPAAGWPEVAARAARTARLAGAAVYWRGAADVRSGLTDLAFTGVAEPRGAAPAGVLRTAFRVPPLTRAARAALWRSLAASEPPAAVTEWSLTPAEVTAAAAVAPAGPAAVQAACAQSLRLGEDLLFSPLPVPFGWDDIVLAEPVRRHLTEFADQVRLRAAVYDDWGFGRLSPLGQGVSALFAGPSGTGKTMAAQVLARELGLQLYRVDLAGVVNKYIGETEKRLRQVFDACERANALLLFDEADALFGRRTQVKDAHDRFANIEIDYLLQRMEQFDGVAVLATNRKADLDSAFLRRLRFVVDFLPPGPAERLRLWWLALPDRTPAGAPLVAGDLDRERLAAQVTLSGAGIKAAALGAAFLARAEGSEIRMAHVTHAAAREMTKHGIEAPYSERRD